MPTRILTISTATGVFGPVDFGDVYVRATVSIANASTNTTYVGDVEGAIGNSPNWTSVIALTTANSTGAYLSSTGTPFDKLRVNLSANASTASTPVWLSASD
jgi:hypothetical protein